MTRQGSRLNSQIAGPQQTYDGTAPDGFNLLFFEKQIAPDAAFDIETAAGDGNMNVRVLIELASVGVHGAEDADLDAQLKHCRNGHHQRYKTEPLAGNKADESAQYYQLSATWPSL